MSVFDEFEKKKEFAVCVDSDGCAMDTMTIKHVRAFGPCLVNQWHLGAYEKEILERWNVINLYSMTRGINRFKGLAMMLGEINESYAKIDGVEALKKWADEAPELSNDGIKKQFGAHPIFEKAYEWSLDVNRTVQALPDEMLRPFDNVKEALELAHEKADVVVVSSANPEAVRVEWGKYGLLDYVDLICTQEVGSKAFCIEKVAEKGYDKTKVLMCGDAPGDADAAAKNDVLFYPIMAGNEGASWKQFIDKALSSFMDGKYQSEMQDELLTEFKQNLGME